MGAALRDRVRGVLVGLATGDRIGGPTGMALCLTQSVSDRGNFDQGDVLAGYLACWRAPARVGTTSVVAGRDEAD